MSELTLWHNPRCSKSRQTLALLQERGLQPVVVEYLREPPSAAELERVLGLLGLEPRQLLRTSEPAYREQGLGDPALSRQQLLQAMVAHPIVIERPVLIRGGRAAVGRPPERVLEILE